MIESLTFDDLSEMSGKAADLVAELLGAALARTAGATLALAGGSTPRGLYQALARSHRDSVRWRDVHFLWGDERYVPAGSPDSNARMATETLLVPLEIAERAIHRVRTDLAGPDAARDYAATVRSVCAASGSAEPMPRIDLVLLGMGPDGHTASLFPGSAALAAEESVVFAEAPGLNPRVPRITMTLPLLNAARAVLFLVAGSEKLPIVREILSGGAQALRYPAARVKPEGRLVWFVHEPR